MCVHDHPKLPKKVFQKAFGLWGVILFDLWPEEGSRGQCLAGPTLKLGPRGSNPSFCVWGSRVRGGGGCYNPGEVANPP